MPGIITHYLFGIDTVKQLKDSPLFPILEAHHPLFLIGLQGPDCFTYYPKRKKESFSSLSYRMHTEKTQHFILSSLAYAKRHPVNSPQFEECMTYLFGFICHYILDAMAYPFIYYISGKYNSDDSNTIIYKGLSKKVELAIDSLLLEHKLNIKAHQFRLYKQVLPATTIPDSIVQLYDEMLFLLYGINNGGIIFKKSYDAMCMYYRLHSDHLGTKQLLFNTTKNILPKKMSSNMEDFSYYRIAKPNIDYLNETKQAWLHPVTGNIYTFSFYDILRNAFKKCFLLLQSTYEFGTSQMSYQDYKELLPDISYITGLSTNDTRPIKYISSTYKKL